MKPLAQNTLIQNRYLIVQLIGKGGMGEVYLAVDQRLGSAIALKRTFFAGDEMLGNAFEREARVLARLRHPVLPKVSDHFSEGEEQYLVMEHISGDDLSKRIEANQKPFPLTWVMFWADQLLDALSYLHSHEPPIIHRDIKPQNLKLTDENHVVLLDFGLSKTSTGQTNLASGTGSTGSVVGYTPHYAPMEQIRGIGTSAKSDLYSLSATLYQLMTNNVPADALTRADTLLNGMPDPIKAPTLLNPEVPPAVSEVILRGMEVSQERRFSTAREMQKSLRKAFSEMQNAMSAKTAVFSASDIGPNGQDTVAEPVFEATEIMDPEALRAISNPIGAVAGSSAFSESISQPTSSTEPVDLNATIAYDSSIPSNPTRQSDVKTEVFIADANSMPAAFSESQPYSEAQPSSEPYEPTATPYVENYAPTTDYSNFADSGVNEHSSQPDAGENYSPQATVPLIAFEEAGGYQEQTGGGNFDRESPVAEDRSDQGAAAVGVGAGPAQRAVAAKKKSSTGKIIAILGGLFLFFIVVLGVGGGGFYYYTNYYAGGVVEPLPSPEPTLEPTPSPEPTIDNTLVVNDTNSNSNSDTNSNSNSSIEVEPTPEPTQRPVQDTPTQRPDPRPTPATRATPRPQPSRTPRPQPTKKPGAPDILQ